MVVVVVVVRDCCCCRQMIMAGNPLGTCIDNSCLVIYHPVQEEEHKSSNSQSHRYHEMVEGF